MAERGSFTLGSHRRWNFVDATPRMSEPGREQTGELREGVSTMISEASKAPAFSLKDHLGREVALENLLGRRHTMLLFYPLDWTPT